MSERDLYLARHRAASHAMQSGVAMEMNYNAQPTDPKHLRVGVNVALVDHASLVGLLIQKGVITDLEYVRAIAEGMEAERDRYERVISELVGAQVNLG